MERVDLMYGTPRISFQQGNIRIEGRSIMLEPGLVFNKLLEDFHRYIAMPLDKTEIHIALDYMNSSSNRYLMNLLILAERLSSHGKKVAVFWYVPNQDEMIREQGILFQELLDLPFNLVEHSSEQDLKFS